MRMIASIAQSRWSSTEYQHAGHVVFFLFLFKFPREIGVPCGNSNDSQRWLCPNFCPVPTCLGIGLVRCLMGQTELRMRLRPMTPTRQMKLSARCSSGGAVTSHRACPGHVAGLVLMPSLGETSAACPMQRRERSPFLSVCIIIYSTRYIIAGVMQNVEEDTSSPYDILCILCYWKFDCINLFSSVLNILNMIV